MHRCERQFLAAVRQKPAAPRAAGPRIERPVDCVGLCVRFWLRNPTQSAINFSVVSVELTAPVRAAMPVHDVVTERGGRARPLSIAPGARVLVMVCLNDPTMVLRRVSTAATYSVVFEAQRARATLSLTVRRATRRRTLR